ncbi:EGF-like repeat and discoidin I-like domain-containing protein 3 isoform X2 [Exaiptasia diaphana]|uniref:EGF-like repeat and discoidin I-like domain-containing protein 3 n=1 Tax=Exaiptasia diaphana TaxID=2652724 RepID=A0A913YGN4_EXADI|nr:EGF-like repeat and discoidin I-like domain-containing protein 3 isoform X2 [Exaiptasia diaphana]
MKKTKYVKDNMDCVFECMGVHWCRSINFKIAPRSNGLHVCQLLSSEQFAGKQYMGPNEAYNHYSVKNPCQETPCRNGGKCVFQENRQHYHCECREGFDGENCEKGRCNDALGMESNAIPDSKITASSYSASYLPSYARLNAALGNGGWTANPNTLGDWIQVDLSKVTRITAIATQGRQGSSYWVKTYSLQYSDDGTNFKDYEGGKTLPGNSEGSTVVKTNLDPAIAARYIRLLPKTYHNHMILRMELYGCQI